MPSRPEPAERARAWRRLLEARPPAWVPGHCRCVEALALAMCACAERQGLAVDRAVVSAGALLHDLGRSVTQDVRHASVGADLLRADGKDAWDERVVLCVERHTGAGIDAQEAKALALPVKDYTPRSLEERIVCHADNLYSGEKRLSLGDALAKYEAKGLSAAGRKIAALHEALERELGTGLGTLEPIAMPVP
ncbi:MAG TPA: HD domain-containing protein [Candidatus Thermoplasmatota archaeon]|nr:HD domain-containing protein [Candidatus Thermoplasmatota archaeon]